MKLEYTLPDLVLARSQSNGGDTVFNLGNSFFPPTTHYVPHLLQRRGFMPERALLPSTWVIPHLLEYYHAGKNVSNFCHHLSSQEQRPVLVLNNARVGALFQIGFQHWLQNFKTHTNALCFVEHIKQDPSFQKVNLELHRQIESLSKLLLENKNAKYSTFQNDPSLDLRLETDLYHHDLQPVTLRIDAKSLLASIQKGRDQVRSIIFMHAQDWLHRGQLRSFVYPVNHFKLSSNGGVDGEMDRFAEDKFHDTLFFEGSLLVMADAHTFYKGPTARSTLARRLEKHNLQDDHSQEDSIVQLLLRNEVHSAVLEYPFSPAARVNYKDSTLLATPRGASIQKSILEDIGDKRTSGNPVKAVDLFVTFPSQGISTIGKDWNTGHWNRGGRRNEIYEYFDYDPEFLMSCENYEEERRLVDDLQRTPSWVPTVEKIIVEPNYGYQGNPEFAASGVR